MAKLRIAVLLLLLGGLLWVANRAGLSPRILYEQTSTVLLCGQAGFCAHLFDRAAVLPKGDRANFEAYLWRIQRESDVDVRLAFVNGTGDRTLESFAVELVDELGIGRKTGGQRGVLLLYDVVSRRLKVEVGYGLEGYFPDVFVSYLVNQHARLFFESGDLTLGLRLMLRLLQHRIREAVLGDEFDPRALDLIASPHLSGGAGVAADMSEPSGIVVAAKWSDDQRAGYAAGASPFETYAAYLRWLAQPVRDPAVDFLTPGSRRYVAGLTVSPAYAQFILMAEYGKRFEIVAREDRAVLYFTSTPLVSPHFFVREDGRWRMDLVAEVGNTRQFAGGGYNWLYSGSGDPYSRAFADLLKPVARGYWRFKAGDNRWLRTRG